MNLFICKKALTSKNIKIGFKACGIWPLNSQAMVHKMEPCKTFKSMEIEVEEIVEKILEQGGLSEAKINSTHYYIEYDVNEEE